MKDSSNSNLHSKHRERVRARYLKDGIDGLEPHQVLELILFYAIPRKDTNELAHILLDKFGSLSNVFEAPCKELMKVEGIGEQAAIFLNMISQLKRRYEEDKLNPKMVLRNIESAANYCKSLFFGRIYECFFLICLNSQNRIIHTEKISEGTLDETPVYPRNVVRTALQNNAFSVILTHNHPGGSLTPSEADINTTKTIKNALGMINIELRDHIIVSNENYLSFEEEKLL